VRSKLKFKEFYQKYQKRLQLSFLSKEVGLDNIIQISTQSTDSYEAVDYLNVIRPSSVVIIGHQESKYLIELDRTQLVELLTALFSGPVSTMILSRASKLLPQLVKLSNQFNIPLLQSEQDDAELLNNTRYYLSLALADHKLEHGVFVEVFSLGVFIRGESGIGKSELALALISRGHRLIADDVTEFSRVSPDKVDGHSPGILTDFLEIRGLGIVNIRAMFGSNSLKPNKTLRLIIEMVHFNGENNNKFDRLGSTKQNRNILGLDFPQYSIPVAPGRNLAVLVEAATRSHLLEMNGYNASDDFIERQRKAIRESSEKK